MNSLKTKIGVLVFILALAPVRVFAKEAGSGVTFSPFASIRALFGYRNNDLPDGSSVADDETDLVYRLQGNSRVGANFKAGDKVTGTVDIGLQSSVNLRHANATYDFGFVKFLVGQDDTPYSWYANADYTDDNNLTGFGVSSDGRNPQVKVSSNGFYIDFIGASRNTGSITADDTTVLYPKTAIGYDFKAEGVQAGLGGVYNAVKLNGGALDGKTISSWLGYVHGDVAFGIVGIRANLAYAQNAGNFGLSLSPGNSDSLASNYSDAYKTAAYAAAVGTTIKNSTHLEGFINSYVNLIPDLVVDLAVGYQQDKIDVSGAKADAQILYAVDAVYSVDKNLSFSPAVSYRDYLKDSAGDKQGSEYYAGVKVQFDLKS